jgi:hypothetical protein
MKSLIRVDVNGKGPLPAHLGVVGVHDGLGSRPDRDGLLKVRLASAGRRGAKGKCSERAVTEKTALSKDSRSGNPGDFRSETLDVILLALKDLG